MNNILHVVSVYFSLRYFIGDQFSYFGKKGYKMHVICSPNEYIDNYSKEQGFSYAETPINRAFSLIEDIGSIKFICEYIKKNNIDVIVGHSPKGALLSMIAGKLCGVKKRIYFRHGLVYETSFGLKRAILIAVDRLTSFCSTQIVCVSPSILKKSIEDRLASAKKQIILGNGTCNGIDTSSQFNPVCVDAASVSSLKEQYGINDGDFVIGYSGRLVRDKGIIELVDAFKKLSDSDNCKLLLVGPFEERDALPDDIKGEILSNPNIIYTGFVDGNMNTYYAIMDVYVLPSYREGFPTGVLEAQSMGIPVVTTKVTGCCDSIIEGLTGLFVTHNPEDIANKIDMIRRSNIIDGKEGRKWVVDHFDSQIVWNEIEKLYL